MISLFVTRGSPPRPPLFPYSPLFRSRLLVEAAVLREAGQRVRLAGAQEAARLALDRKSTRLNSSHANSSYAVCRLKKEYRTAGLRQRLGAADDMLHWPRRPVTRRRGR